MKYIEATPKECQNLNLKNLDWDFDKSYLTTENIDALTEECNAIGVTVAISNGKLKLLVAEDAADAFGIGAESDLDIEEIDQQAKDEETPMTREEIMSYIDQKIKETLEMNEVLTKVN